MARGVNRRALCKKERAVGFEMLQPIMHGGNPNASNACARGRALFLLDQPHLLLATHLSSLAPSRSFVVHTGKVTLFSRYPKGRV